MSPAPDPDQERLRALRTLLAREAEPPFGEVKADINVTPLVDVVLVLLIIFMVVTPMIASGVAVDLPRTLHHTRKPDDGKDIVVSITADERIFVGSKQLARLADLAPVVIREQRLAPSKEVYLKGDTRVSFGTVREALDTLRANEVHAVILGTEARDDEPTQ